MGVSIHAPVWGATDWYQGVEFVCDVSIHAPVWGATMFPIVNHKFIQFQSTHPCGVRPTLARLPMGKVVSIHAPVWGATLFHFHLVPSYGFNPRTRVGCDLQALPPASQWMFQSTHPCGVRPYMTIAFNDSRGFQSTHPCGVRLRICFLLTWIYCFNPRTRVGCDDK